MGVAEGTLADWARRSLRDGLAIKPLGRPPKHADPLTRRDIRVFLETEGPRTGLPTLRAAFPEVARGELVELTKRVRWVIDARYRGWHRALEWRLRGAVWAIDHSDAPCEIDGRYGKLLLVRELEAGVQLLADPVDSARAEPAIRAIEALFVQHGPPLVIKADRGSAFVSEDFAEMLRRWGVELLLSPARCPRYNGACEAGVGSIKRRAAERAARHGRPGRWTCDDVEAALAQANAGRPRGHAQPSPEELWRDREPIAGELRAAFRATVATLVEEVRAELGLQRSADAGATIDARTEPTVTRLAIERALCALDLLRYRRGRITPPISR